MSFPARVIVTLRDGRRLEARCDVPRGGAGHATTGPDAVAREKLLRWGPRLWGEAGTVDLDAAIDADDARAGDRITTAIAASA